jgi:hypothetical protein
MKKLKRKYKFQGGIQRIQNDTPDYSNAYNFKAEQNAKMQAGKNIGKTGLDIAGTAIGVPGLGGMAEGLDQVANAAFKDAKGNYKSKTAELLNNGLNPLEKIGKGFSAITGDKAAAADLFSGNLVGTGLMKLGMKNPFGKTSEEIGKEKTAQAEEATRIANINKRYSEGTATDAQAALAKKGKYKVKTKQSRLIETEGREPIFSPKKADGTRDLLYYNPNDPTHEEGGVKAMVIPKAQGGKQKLKAKPVPKEEYTPLEDDDSILEEIGEIFDPTGISSYDDVYRSAHNLIKNKNRGAEDYVDVGMNVLGALPVVGKAGKLTQLAKKAFKYIDKGADAGKIIQRANRIKKASQEPINTGNKFTRTIKRAVKTARVGDRINDLQTVYGLAKEPALFENPEWSRTHSLENAKFLGRRIFPKSSNENMYPNGAKQLKVNDLNNTAFSQNLSNTPSANAANAFFQPQAEINQVARQLPEKRRKEKIGFPKSYRKENPDTNRVISPPTRFDNRPKQAISRYNKGSKKVKVYR